MIGLVLGNTKSAPRIRKLVHPLRDAFGALAARVYRMDRFAALNIGLTVLSRGEFALVLAALAATHSAWLGRLLPDRTGSGQERT